MSHYTRGEIKRAEQAAKEEAAQQQKNGKLPYSPVNTNSISKFARINLKLNKHSRPVKRSTAEIPGQGLITHGELPPNTLPHEGGKRRRKTLRKSRRRMTRRR